MPFTHLDNIESKEIMPGFHGKFVHTDEVTMASWQVEAGSGLPEHSHPPEQVTMLLEGKFEMTVGGETRTLVPGGVAVIPANVSHSGKALTDCRLIDIFHPARDDYR